MDYPIYQSHHIINRLITNNILIIFYAVQLTLYDLYKIKLYFLYIIYNIGYK